MQVHTVNANVCAAMELVKGQLISLVYIFVYYSRVGGRRYVSASFSQFFKDRLAEVGQCGVCKCRSCNREMKTRSCSRHIVFLAGGASSRWSVLLKSGRPSGAS